MTSTSASIRPGIELLEEVEGTGALAVRQRHYDVRLRMWLHRGEPVRWTAPWGILDRARIEDDGTTLFTSLRLNREYMFNGLFYGMEGMRVGGLRRLRVAPHLGFREAGVPGVIPANALLIVEVDVLAERPDLDRPASP